MVGQWQTPARSAEPVTWHRAGHVVLPCLGIWRLERHGRSVNGSDCYPQAFTLIHPPIHPQTHSFIHSTPKT